MSMIAYSAGARRRGGAGHGRLARTLATVLEVLAFSLIFIVLGLAGSLGPARAAPVGGDPYVSPGDVKTGSLLLKGAEAARYVEAPRIATDADLTVSGPTIRGRITQIFHNPTDGWVEGVYVWPLPEGAAVDTMRMTIGKRVIIADIKERGEAKQIYEKAKADGKAAALMEQERPNIFTNSVANIGPGESVVIQIEYQEPVRQQGNRFSLRLPLVVAPRYNPEPELRQTVDMRNDGEGWVKASDPVPDRARITPPVLDPRRSDAVNPVTIAVHLSAGFPLASVESPYHTVKIDGSTADRREITLAAGPVPADRDFELDWTAEPAATPSVGLFSERVAGQDYVLAYVTPPAGSKAPVAKPREVTFVIDNSGSMSGPSMEQARASLLYALGRLKAGDRFNVIRFDDTMTNLFGDTVPVNRETIDQARSFVAALEANGGTEMVPPMAAALADPRPNDRSFVRQVVFLTDGEIGNEQELFGVINAKRGRSRLFMVGIGSAPNGYLMTRAAEIGRGAFTQIGGTDEVDGKMRKLFDKLENPVVTGLVARFDATKADLTPETLPDVYAGEPLVLAARIGSRSGNMTIEGRIGDRPWSITLPLSRAAPGKGLSKMWARRKIDDAEVARITGQMPAVAADGRILKLALEHHLVTRLTSLVAVDERVLRPSGERLTRADVPLNLPEGWDFDKVYGEEDDDGLPPGQRKASLDDGAGKLIAVALAPSAPAEVQPVALPQTATDAQLRMLLGLALALAGFLVAGRSRLRGRMA